MTYSRLIKLLHIERRILEQSWDSNTAYPESISKNDSVKSEGQCFVSSLFLYFNLKELLDNYLELQIHRGIINDLNGNLLIEDHCWLEIERANEKCIVIDLTLDQCKAVKNTVVCCNKENTKKQLGVSYHSFRKYSFNNINEIENKHTRIRYSKLLNNRRQPDHNDKSPRHH